MKMKLTSLTLYLLAQSALGTALRFVMYADQYHTTDMPGREKMEGITHAIMAFAEAKLFNSDGGAHYTPFESVETFRGRFAPDTKVLFAVGGWGDTASFSTGTKDEASRERFARNIAAVVKNGGFDGVDIDWEYPGGNGEDYKRVPNSQRTDEIETFPLFLSAIRSALGKDKILSIAVPGKRVDMIAFTKEQGPKIWESVDMVNVMSYDLMNRRDNVTKHHASVEGSLDTVRAYQDVGLTGDKINLGFPYYAKWFTTVQGAGCEEHPLGCPVELLESADGADTGKSGAFTFEKSTMAEPPRDLKQSADGQYYGECKGLSLKDSWRKAQENGKLDEQAGGQYYFDEHSNIFWTWDTMKTIERKFNEIVEPEQLGGVMAWSLAEDSLNWEHLDAMTNGVMRRQSRDG
ncbi:hypothetical protein EYZ11_006756 [Aspergillus tanneri]|uniref:chitinase n=1 Tax=Aspergillus tanneri TaxID=1220188 RepID=A0A4S3JEQ2_9EURO|nr:hypothetical protein EYZ11_006756 [Aspergillus tanneri]